MCRWLVSSALGLALTFGVAHSAQGQFGISFGSGIGGFGPGYGSGLSLSVGQGIGFNSGYGYSGYGYGRPYGGSYNAYRPYGGFGPVFPSGYGAGYSYLGAPVFRAPVYVRPRVGIVRRRF